MAQKGRSKRPGRQAGTKGRGRSRTAPAGKKDRRLERGVSEPTARPAGQAKRRSTGRARPAAAARTSRRPAAAPSPKAPIEGSNGPEILLRLEELLRRRIHGKDDAVDRIASAVRVRLIQLDFRPERPNGTFLLVGPPGVGKNEFAYALADILYGDESVVVPVDMRAMANEEDVIRLVDVLIPGPPPTLYEGLLTAPVRRRPHTILLLRGIDQAHPAALRMIQKINEQGWIEDAQGRLAFDRTIVFATARVPDDENGPTSEIGFNRTAKTIEERVLEKLRRRVSEEFLDSFQEVVVLSALSPEDVRQIARYKVRVVLDRLQQGRRGVEVSDSIYAAFIPDEDARACGAGTLNQTLENKLLNPLARYLLEHPQEQRIRVDVRDGHLVIEPASRSIVAGSGPSGVAPRRGKSPGKLTAPHPPASKARRGSGRP